VPTRGAEPVGYPKTMATWSGAVTGFALAAIPQPHNPNVPQVLARSVLANAATAT